MVKPVDFNPEPTFPEGHRRAGKIRCTAWARTANDGAGGQCSNTANESGKCRYHGGASPRGPASPAWKHGKYENRSTVETPYYKSVAQTRWRAAYIRFLESTEALTLSGDLALNHARIEDQITALGNTVTYEFLDALDEHTEAMKAAMQVNDPQSVAMGIAAIIKLSKQAREDLIGQDKLDRLVSQRMDLVGREQRAIEKQERQMNTGQVVALMLRVFSSICDVIADNTDEPVANVIFDQSRLALQSGLIYLGAEEMMVIKEDEDQNGR